MTPSEVACKSGHYNIGQFFGKCESDIARRNVDRMKANGDIPGLLKVVMKTEPGPGRDIAAEAIAAIGGPMSVKSLIAAIRHKETHIGNLTKAVQRLKDVAFVAPLIERASSEYPGGKQEIRDMLVGIGEPAVGILAENISHHDWEVAGMVIDALIRIASPKARPAFMALLKNEKTRIEGAKGLLRIGDTGSLAVNALVEVMKSEAWTRLPSDVVSTLEEAGWTPPPSDNVASAWWWATKEEWEKVPKTPDAATPLLVALKDAMGNTRKVCAIARALGETRAAEAVRPLIEACDTMERVHLSTEAPLAILSALRMFDDQEAKTFVKRKEQESEKISHIIDSLPEDEGGLKRALLAFSGAPKIEMAIGERLWKLGGKEAMLEAHSLVAERKGRSAARLLESTWDGIGTWKG
jgi:HEAT repeat protein